METRLTQWWAVKFVRSERLKSGELVDLYASPGRNADRNRDWKSLWLQEEKDAERVAI